VNARSSHREYELRQGNNKRGKDRTMPELLAFRRIKIVGSFPSKILVPLFVCLDEVSFFFWFYFIFVFYSHDRLCATQFHCIQYDDNEDKEIIETIIYKPIFRKEKLVKIFNFQF